MVRSEVVNGVWTIPAMRMKAGVEHVVPLSAAALDVLASLPSNGGLIFTVDGLTPIGGFGYFKRQFDRTVPLPNWTLHDLRRTARSLMSRANVPERHAEACLGHVVPGVAGIYDRHKYLDEMRRAYELLASQIETIVNPPTGNVVAFRSGE